MNYQVLARKWRPQTFKEVLGQEHITTALSSAIKHEKIAHAYLLTGTRGVGKTTIARIFAKAICCENLTPDGDACGKCSSCLSIQDGSSLDYIEADGASNNKVENIRELIDTVSYLPTSGKYKVYVIDEVHMLTTSAFNALLKTLEEPPAHVVFIFATTDPQKLLGTVLSRCQRFDFKSLTTAELEGHISRISKEEGIKFSNERLISTIAKHGNGSVRDTLSLLDQVLSLSVEDVVTDEIVNDSLGLANQKFIKNILDAVLTNNNELFSATMSEVSNQNIELKVFISQLQEELFKAIIDTKNGINNSMIPDEALESVGYQELLWVYETFAKDLDWILASLQPELSIQVSLLKILTRNEVFNESENKIQIVKKKVKPVVKNWDGALSFIAKHSKTLAINLEHGNEIEKLQFFGGNLNVKIGYPEQSKVFYEVVKEPANKFKFIELMAEYFEIDKKNVNLTVILLESKQKEEMGFKSKVEIHQEKEAETEKLKRESLLSNKYIKQAESLFNGKVSKITLNK
jgi:DNA polymerase-3 subunit gamma/tau